jgi:hypothetical protein
MIKLQNSVFIDPENCGSNVGYYITVSEYKPKDKPIEYSIQATVVLTDCNHKLDWAFRGGVEEKAALEKIDSALAMLQEFRKKFVETTKLVSRLNK